MFPRCCYVPKPPPGCTVGVLCNELFPDVLITTVLVVLLAFMCKNTLHKGLTGWRTESNQTTPHHIDKAYSTQDISLHTAPLPQVDHAGLDYVHHEAAPTGASLDTPTPLEQAVSPDGLLLPPLPAVIKSFPIAIEVSPSDSYGGDKSPFAAARPDTDDADLAAEGQQQPSTAVAARNAVVIGYSHKGSEAAAGSSSSGKADTSSQRQVRWYDGKQGVVADVEACVQDHSAADPQHNSRMAAGFTFPAGRFLALVALWLGFAALHMLKEQQEQCSWQYFAAFGGQLLFGVSSSLLFGWLCLLRASRQRSMPEATGSSHDDVRQPLLQPEDTAPAAHRSGMVKLTYHQLTVLQLLLTLAVVAVAGSIAGLVGIGGGMMMGPLLLRMGAHPQVSCWLGGRCCDEPKYPADAGAVQMACCSNAV